MYIVEAAKNPIVLNEGLFSQYTDKPFDGKYKNMKLIISKSIKNIDIDKAIDYIESNILPILDRTIVHLAENFMTAGQIKNQKKRDKIIERIFKKLDIKICPSSIIGNKYEGKKYDEPYVLIAYSGIAPIPIGIHIISEINVIFTGNIDDNGNMHFTHRRTKVVQQQPY